MLGLAGHVSYLVSPANRVGRLVPDVLRPYAAGFVAVSRQVKVQDGK